MLSGKTELWPELGSPVIPAAHWGRDARATRNVLTLTVLRMPLLIMCSKRAADNTAKGLSIAENTYGDSGMHEL